MQLNFQHICVFAFYLLLVFEDFGFFFFFTGESGEEVDMKKIPHKEGKQSYRTLEFVAKRLPEKFSRHSVWYHNC